MKKFMIISFVAISIVILGNILKINGWIARYSVPAAVYVTIYPFPFYYEGSYNSGSFQGIQLGGDYSKLLWQIAKNNRCEILIKDRLVDIGKFIHSKDDPFFLGPELVFRCKSGGVAWNEIVKIENEKVTQVRISGGLWT